METLERLVVPASLVHRAHPDLPELLVYRALKEIRAPPVHMERLDQPVHQDSRAQQVQLAHRATLAKMDHKDHKATPACRVTLDHLALLDKTDWLAILALLVSPAQLEALGHLVRQDSRDVQAPRGQLGRPVRLDRQAAKDSLDLKVLRELLEEQDRMEIWDHPGHLERPELSEWQDPLEIQVTLDHKDRRDQSVPVVQLATRG